MIRFCIYSRSGSFVTSFETYIKADLWRKTMGSFEYTIRKERWHE
jgi:hypothetical protein